MAWLDNIRVWLTVLVVAHHCAVTYSDIPLWPYWEQPRDRSAILLDVFAGINQTWFMGLFFLLAGFFVPAAVDRRGVGGFLRGRLLRLGVPLVLFSLIVSPIYRYLAWASSPQARGTSLAGYLLTNFDLGPLWFVLVLLIFSLAYAGLRAWLGSRPAGWAMRTPGFGTILGAAVVLGLVGYLWHIVCPDGTYWPLVGPSPSYLPQYAGAFAVGALAARRRWLQDVSVRTGWLCLPVALLSWLASVAVLAAGGEAASGGGSLLSLAGALSTAMSALSTMTVVLVAFRSWFDRSGPGWRFLSDQAFTVYVVHGAVLVWLGVALAGFAAPALVKALVLLVLGAPATWALAWLVRRIPGATRVF